MAGYRRQGLELAAAGGNRDALAALGRKPVKQQKGWQAVIDAPRAPEAPPAQYEPTEEEKLAESRDKRFGNDMAWLDELFQENGNDTLNQALARGTTADAGAQAAQRQGVNQFFDIANGGGATALERARRQKARGESENWLLGQREADMQNLSERGMSGGGAEILNLLGDRQAAATRLSQADLDTDAALERRALDALMSGTQLAGDMERSSNAYVQGNASIIDAAQARSKGFLRDAYQNTMANRQSWDANVLNHQVAAANNMAARSQQDNWDGYRSGRELATGDSGRVNAAKKDFNNASVAMWNGTTPGVLGTGAAANQSKADFGTAQGNLGAEAMKTGLEMAAGAQGGGAGGMAAMGGGNWFGGSKPNTGTKPQQLDPWKR